MLSNTARCLKYRTYSYIQHHNACSSIPASIFHNEFQKSYRHKSLSLYNYGPLLAADKEEVSWTRFFFFLFFLGNVWWFSPVSCFCKATYMGDFLCFEWLLCERKIAWNWWSLHTGTHAHMHTWTHTRVILTLNEEKAMS